MAQVIPFGDPVNDAERMAIAHLRDHLPNSYLVLHNFEIHRGDETFEVDIAVIAPHAVYLVDAKGTHGTIEVSGPKWYPAGRAPFTSPLSKLRSHARALKGLITDSHPARRELNGIYVDAVFLLTAPDAVLNDPSGGDARDVVTWTVTPRLWASPNTLAIIADWKSPLESALSEEDLKHLRGHSRTGRPLGDETFMERLESAAGRALKPQKRGAKPTQKN